MFQSGKQSFSSEPGNGNDSTVPTTTISSPNKTKKLTIYRLSSHKDAPGAINASSLSESLKRMLFPTSQDHSVNAPTPSKLIKIMPGDQNKVKTGKKKKKLTVTFLPWSLILKVVTPVTLSTRKTTKTSIRISNQRYILL